MVKWLSAHIKFMPKYSISIKRIAAADIRNYLTYQQKLKHE